MLVEKFVKSKTFSMLPNFIREHQIFSQIKRIDKPFEHIGLKNSLEPIVNTFNDPLLAGKKLYIGFTGNNTQGLWDIATMSMRGVSSCMHWQNKHSSHLVGSITDPFLGMIYISDNEMTNYGISIRKRCLVRIVALRFAQQSSCKYYLHLERPYRDSGNTNPTIYINRDAEANLVYNIFTNYLEKYCSPSVKIDRGLVDNYIPLSTGAQLLFESYRSLRDSGLSYLPYTGSDELIKNCSNQN